jgi:hypothetical protein
MRITVGSCASGGAVWSGCRRFVLGAVGAKKKCGRAALSGHRARAGATCRYGRVVSGRDIGMGMGDSCTWKDW